VIGVPLGVLLGRSVWDGIADSNDLVRHTDVWFLGLLLLAAAIGASALALSWWPARRASRAGGGVGWTCSGRRPAGTS